MADFRFLHAADLHLDSPLRGLEADASAPVAEIRNATRLALGHMVDLAIEEKVAFVIIAGDIYDGDWPDFGTGLFFSNQMHRLTRAGIAVFAIRGNHDAANRMTRSLRMPHVTLFDHHRPQTHRIEALGVAIHGQSFATQAVTDNLAKDYPARIEGLLNIGVLHTSVEGYAAHARYAPCDLPGLLAKGYDYWALGHVHERRELSNDPPVVFPGNLQGRHIGEAGPKGASLVTVTGGRVTSVAHRDLDVLRWAHLQVDLTGAGDEIEAMTRVQTALDAALREAEPRRLAARITLSGTTPAHAALCADGLRERILNEALGLTDEHRFWLESLKLRTKAPLDDATGRPDTLHRLLTEIETLAAAPPAELLGDWPALLLGKLGDALPKPADGSNEDPHPLRDCTEGRLTAVLDEARRRLEAALGGL